MTSFDADLERLASQLATMAAAPGTTTAANDTATVNLARRTLRNCCRVMLTDLAPPVRDDTDSPPRLADLALDPIGVLHTLLQPDPPALTLETTWTRHSTPRRYGKLPMEAPGRSRRDRHPWLDNR